MVEGGVILERNTRGTLVLTARHFGPKGPSSVVIVAVEVRNQRLCNAIVRENSAVKFVMYMTGMS